MENDIQTTLVLLRTAFIANLPERLASLEKLLAAVEHGESESVETLHRTAHSLVGAAGMHRLMRVADAARNLERIVAAAQKDKAVGQGLSAMRAALESVAREMADASLACVPPPPTRRTSIPRVMVVEDDEVQAKWLRTVLEQAGYQVETISDLAVFRSAFEGREAPAAVIMDMVFPEGENAGAQIVSEIKEKHLSGLPVIFLSMRQDMAAKLAAYRAGASRYLTKPVEREVLLRAVGDSAALAPMLPYRVLVVDDDAAQLAAHAAILRQSGMEVREADDPLQVPQILENFAAETLVLDMYMPQCSGPELAAILREEERHAALPIVYLSAESDISRQLLALDRGGDHFLTKPVEPRHLIAAVALHARRFRQAREQAEALRTTLYERERQQQAIDAHAIISMADTDGNIVYVNDSFCAISGYNRSELVGSNHRIVKSNEHPPEFYASMWHTISSGRIWQGEVCNRSKDGRHYWVETSIVPYMDSNGRPYQYISIRTDITDVKEAEERLRLSQVYANIGTWDWNIRTGELYWSERIGPMFGYHANTLETTYAHFLAAVHPDDRQRVREAVAACVEHGDDYHIEHRCVWPDGTVRWLLERGDAVRDSDGAPLHMLGVVQDITDSKLAKQSLAESRARLVEAQTLAKLGNWEADLVTGALRWSEEIYRIFGQDPARFTPSVEAFQRAIHPDDADLVRESERRAAETGIHNVVHRIIRADGEVRYVHELARSLCDLEGRVSRLSGTIQDVTELKQAEQALIHAKEAAESASRAKSEFLASMSHELRTPLNAILGFSQLFGMDSQLPAQTKEQAREIERAGQHLLSLINDLIDLARIEAGKLELAPETISVLPILRDSLAMVAPIALKQGIELREARCHCNIEQASVRADYVRLRQVVINLLSNAIKYNRPHGSVRLSCSTDNGMVRITVADTGPGIPADKQARIFNAFDRLGAECGSVEGTGIGLVITQRIVAAMGGSIGFISSEEQGSTFWVEFPAIAPNEPPAPADAAKIADPVAAAPQPRRPVILYVEDNPMNLRLMQQVFAMRKGLELRAASTAESGIDMARAEPPDLILMDINLPGMDGYQALARLKADPGTAHIPVVAVSANAMKGDENKGLEAGFAAYLVKPINVPALLEILDKVGGQKSGTTGAEA